MLCLQSYISGKPDLFVHTLTVSTQWPRPHVPTCLQDNAAENATMTAI